MAKIGQGKLNLHPCTPEQMEQNLTIIEQKFEIIEQQGAIDNFTVRAATGGTPQFLDGLLFNTGVVFDGGLHQAVYGETVDNSGQLQIRFFTAIGSGGGGDTYRVKRDAADASPQYLADCWASGNYNATDSYVASTHFHVTVSPTGTNDLRLYCPYAIIKVDENDATPGMLYAKCADQAAYNAAQDRIVRVQNMGGTLRFHMLIADLIGEGGSTKTIIEGRLAADVASGDATFQLTNCIRLAGSIAPSSTETVTNRWQRAYSRSGIERPYNMTAIWEDANSRWVDFTVNDPAIGVVIDSTWIAPKYSNEFLESAAGITPGILGNIINNEIEGETTRICNAMSPSMTGGNTGTYGVVRVYNPGVSVYVDDQTRPRWGIAIRNGKGQYVLSWVADSWGAAGVGLSFWITTSQISAKSGFAMGTGSGRLVVPDFGFDPPVLVSTGAVNITGTLFSHRRSIIQNNAIVVVQTVNGMPTIVSTEFDYGHQNTTTLSGHVLQKHTPS